MEIETNSRKLLKVLKDAGSRKCPNADHTSSFGKGIAQ